MIADQLSVFFDKTPAAASAVSPALNVSPYAGRGGAVNITVILSGAGAAALALTLEESADNLAFTHVSSYTLEKPGAPGAALSFALPGPLQEKFVRLGYTLTGAPAGLKIFAAVTRGHFAPYAEGQYIDRGKVVA